jgi:hypothetical protein
MFTRVWKEYVKDEWVNSVVREGYSLELTSNPPFSGVRETGASLDHLKVLSEEIEELISKDAVVPVPPHQEGSGFYCTFFVVPKKDSNKLRPILNLKPLNVFIQKKRFKMETLKNVKNALQTDDWIASIDLKDAYLHVPIRPSHQKYLRFKVMGQAYQWTVLPFGLASAPRVFTKVLAPLVALARLQGINVYPYLDDWLVSDRNPRKLEKDVQFLLNLLQQFGWVVNWEKSHLSPSQDLCFIGAHFMTSQGMVYLPSERKYNLISKVIQLKSQNSASARQFLSLLGLMASCIEVVNYARLMMRPIQLFLLFHWKMSSRNLKATVPVTDHLRYHLQWWESEVNLSQGVPLNLGSPQQILVTDASNLGWGGYLESGGEVQGKWSKKDLDQNPHINLKEMEAVVRACHHFLAALQNCHVLIRCDNVTVVSYLNKLGGTRSPSLCVKTWLLFLCLKRNRTTVQAVHIRGLENVRADRLSRRFVNPLEWQLKPSVVKEIFNRWDRPLIDLFASSQNCQLPTYCTKQWDPQAYQVDALAMSWEEIYGYAYPPLSLVPKILQKIRTTSCTVILIAPRWPRRSWYSQILELLIDMPLRLPQISDLLSQERGRIVHPEPQFLELVAWKVSGILSLQREFQKELRRLFCNQSGPVPERPIMQSGDVSLAGVMNGVRIPIQPL